MDIFDNINPMDFRYYGRNPEIFSKLKPYLSEKASIQYMAKVELALVITISKRKICSKEDLKNVESAIKKVRPELVYAEEDRIHHNVRALVNVIRKHVPDRTKPFIHFCATSNDIICTADALRYKEVSQKVVLPMMRELLQLLIDISMKEKDTVQIGRTHGQHAEPITFGFTMAEYVSRIGRRILRVKHSSGNFRGKMAGAVGAYNAQSLFFDDPIKFEKEVLKELELKPSTHSTQIVEPEFVLDYLHALTSTFGILANLADDLRHLQRSEIGEVSERFGKSQVGSSTMPHKRNPINFENIKSMWKAYMPRMITQYLDQISEHQRDLTNSASQRYVPESIASLCVVLHRLIKVLKNLVVVKENMKRNFDSNRGKIAAEPLYILLSSYNHPDAHEKVRELTLLADQSGKDLLEISERDDTLKPYFNKMTKNQLEILRNPELYIGIASKKVEDICKFWAKKHKL